ncbi:hypothetical protein [Methylopila sp. M107]|uniref:hypothetical protein n=1 Tax=Methylopila sp. M107 TaxID=1101190 RepID=UPI00036ACF19|nr:hypothetical protein [Methylopila sp. M107]
MAEGRIPFEAIDRFADRAGMVASEEFDRFERMIRAMDDEFLERRRPKGKDAPDHVASMKDGAAVVGLLQRLAERAGGEE